MSLKARFAAAFTGYTCLILALFAGAYYVVERKALKKAQTDEHRQAVEKLASVCRQIPATGSAITAIDYIKVLTGHPSIRFVACYDSRGTVIAHSDASKLGSARPVEAQAGLVVRSAPFIVGREAAGLAAIGCDEAVFRELLQERLWSSLRQPLAVAAAASAVGLLLSLLLAWSLSRPINDLAEGARSIGAGNLDFQTPLAARKDELGLLSREMTAMARQLKELDELKDEFIAHVSHDLRNPMAAIDMYAQRLLESARAGEPFHAQHSEVLTLIRENAARLGLFVTNILDAAKIKAGRMEYKSESVELKPILENVRTLFAALAQSKGLSIACDVPPGLPAIKVDAEKLERAVANLLSNSIKFTKSGGKISLQARMNGKGVMIYISDTGRGIPKESARTLFRRFHQAATSGQEAGHIPGSGLGLYIVKQTVEGMNGSVDLDSEPGRGTTVTLRFPS